MSETNSTSQVPAQGRRLWVWLLAAVLAAALVGITTYAAIAQTRASLPVDESSAAATTSETPHELSTVELTILGQVPHADAQILETTTAGWALVMWQPSTWESDGKPPENVDVLLASPQGEVYHLTDIDPSFYVNLGTDSWQAGEKTAHALVSRDDDSELGFSNYLAEIDLLTGEVALGAPLNLRNNEELVGWFAGQAIFTSPVDRILFIDAEGNIQSRPGSQVQFSADGETLFIQQTHDAGGASWEVVDQSFTAVGSGAVRSDMPCEVAGWDAEGTALESCSEPQYVLVDGTWEPTGAVGADWLTLDTTTGEVTRIEAGSDVISNEGVSNADGNFFLGSLISQSASNACSTPYRWEDGGVRPVAELAGDVHLLGAGGHAAWFDKSGCTEASATQLDVFTNGEAIRVFEYPGDEWFQSVGSVSVAIY